MALALGGVIIVLAAAAVYRGIDVRLALLLAALALGTLGGRPLRVVRVFLETFSNERYVVPICTAMGFAYVLRLTQCDRHLVHLLLRPVMAARWLLIPGTVLAGFLVNIPVVSQTSTAVTLGAVAIPLLLAARVTPLTAGATLLLGASIGGELLNPGAPELRTVVEESEKAARQLGQPSPGLTGAECVARILPLDLIGLAVAGAVFWLLSARAERRARALRGTEAGDAAEVRDDFRVNPVKAMIPLVPLVLLFLTGPPLRLLTVSPTVLVEPPRADPRDALAVLAVAPGGGLPAAVPWAGVALTAPAERPLPPALRGLFDSRLIGAAMLVGVVAAALVSLRQVRGVAGAFFEGAGYGFTHIISLIVTANCFGEGVASIGLAQLLGDLIARAPWLLLPLAGLVPLGFAALCGSGMAATASLFGFFAAPALRLGIDPALVGAVVSLASAAGRTLSPVAAVTLMCGTLTGSNPLELSRRVAVPLLAGVAAIVVAAMVLASGP
jgi:DcuC family C4-dicarboxylate transporter